MEKKNFMKSILCKEFISFSLGVYPKDSSRSEALCDIL
jgi:hypothetical protein